MLQIFENIWSVLTSIIDFIISAFSSLANGVIFCFQILGQALLYIGCLGPTVIYFIGIIMALYVIWLVLRLIHG